ncbi:hypothetical protein Cgig2_003111 [Carnegiea gigantea]|uniref:RING-type E3 ubiquitin transferase n=1 Tax=Carnegiea gigantea TaxID=171969 RepID=A0A9Q1JNR7_9CARY|nr:hypothetical protein Cgig2_003111 [Carnegiea gigantea]
MASIDATPFLANNGATSTSPSSVRAQGLRHAARMIRLASTGRRGMREPSMAVRETAAQEIEDRQVDWAYSPPVVTLDVAWNSAFVAAAAAALIVSRSNRLHLPLRLWAAGYALQCVIHVVCVCVEFRRRRRRWNAPDEVGGGQGFEESSSVIRQLESANTMFSFVWWMIGFYWLCVGGHASQQESPTLYWFALIQILTSYDLICYGYAILLCRLCIVFLVLDLFFVMFCVALASVIAAAVCCCLPCIIAILYVLTDRYKLDENLWGSTFKAPILGETQGGASKEDIELLPKYKFHQTGSEQKVSDATPGPCEGVMTECETNSPTVRRLTADDAQIVIYHLEFPSPDLLDSDLINYLWLGAKELSHLRSAAFVYLHMRMASSLGSSLVATIFTPVVLISGCTSTLPAPFASLTYRNVTIGMKKHRRACTSVEAFTTCYKDLFQ